MSTPPSPPSGQPPWGHTEQLPVVGYVHQPPSWTPPPTGPSTTQELPVQAAGTSDTSQLPQLASPSTPSAFTSRPPTQWIIIGVVALVAVVILASVIGMLLGRTREGSSTPKATTSASSPRSISPSPTTSTSPSSTTPAGQRIYRLDGSQAHISSAQLDFGAKPKGFSSTQLLGQRALVSRKTSQALVIRTQPSETQAADDRTATTSALAQALTRVGSSNGDSGTVMIPTRSGGEVEFAYRTYTSADGRDRQLMAMRVMDDHLLMVVYAAARDSFELGRALQMVQTVSVTLR